MDMGISVNGTVFGAPANILRCSQFVIPRYSFETNFPANELLGVSTNTLLTGTAATADQDPAAIVVTEGFNDDLSQWQSTSTGKQPAVLRPRLRNLSIGGELVNSDGTPFTGTANAFLNVDISDLNSADKYGGAFLHGMRGHVSSVEFLAIPGTALYVKRDSTTLSGRGGIYDGIRWSLERLLFGNVYRGLHNDATDSLTSNVEISGFRDYGARWTGSGHQIDVVHAYGGTRQIGSGDSVGAALWMDCSKSKAFNCYGENAMYGLIMGGFENTMNGLISHSSDTANVWMTGTKNTLIDLLVTEDDGDATVLGCKITNELNKLIGARIELHNDDGRGVVVTNGNGQEIRADIISDKVSGHYNSTAIECQATLMNSTIRSNTSGGNICLDVNYEGVDRVGSGNDIVITSSAVTPVNLHAGWSITPSTDPNRLYVNGTRMWRA